MTQLESKKKPTFQWDEYRRQVLCCLYRFFREDNKVFAQVFSEFFKGHLLERGFPKGTISYQVLYAQWAWMKRKDHEVWKFVHCETEFRTDREWKDIVNIIKAVAYRLGVLLSEKSLEHDHTYSTRIANERDDSHILSSAEEAISQIVEEVTSVSPMIEPRSPESIWTPSRRQHELPSRLTPETPTPSNVHPPTKSRFWPQNDCPARQEEQEAARMPLSILLRTDTPENLGINKSTEPEEPVACEATLWGLPCFWCNKDGPVEANDEQPKAMDIADIESSKCSRDDSPAPLGIDHQLCQPQLPHDFQSANFLALPGLCMPKDLPPILFRWSNVNSQGVNSRGWIVAGMFARSDSKAFSPFDLDEGAFLEHVKCHVTKAPVQSPFISAFKSLLAPIHRGLRNGDGAMISVIDTSETTTEVFKAVPLVELTNTALPNWKGYGEFLIWHQVPTAAIACTFTISQLEEIAATHPDIGQFLQLDLIRNRKYCSRFLYSDLAANAPPSQDEHAEVLDRLTGLLGLHGNVRALVAREFQDAWTKKFRGLHYEKPDDPEHRQELDLEIHPVGAPHTVTVQVPSVRRSQDCSTMSDSSWEPSSSESDDDSRSSTCGPESTVGSEEILKSPRRVTPSEGYFSVDDDSSVDWRRRSPPADEDEFVVVEDVPIVDEDDDMAEGDWDFEDEWPADETMPEAVPIHWAN